MADRRPDTAQAAPSGAARSGASAAGTAPTPRLDLVRGVVEQIVGQGLKAAEVDAIAEAVQPVTIAFARAKQAQAAEARAARERLSWGATLDLREARSGEGTFASSGALHAEDGREVAVDVRLVGDGERAVHPLRLDITVDAEGRATSLSFSGRAVGDDGAAAAAAAWSSMPVRLRGEDGAVAVTTLGDARSVAFGPGADAGGGHHIDLVA